MKFLNKWKIIAVIYPTSAVAKIKPEKNSGLNGIRTHDLSDTGAVLYQIFMSYQANWDGWSLCEFVYPLRRWDDSEYMKIHTFELRKKEWRMKKWIRNCLTYITAMIIHLFILSSAVQMYEFSYQFTVIMKFLLQFCVYFLLFLFYLAQKWGGGVGGGGL